MARSESSAPAPKPLRLRPLYPRDLERSSHWGEDTLVIDKALETPGAPTAALRPWLAWGNRMGQLVFPQRQRWSGFVAEMGDTPCGLIEVSPFNRTRSTWRVDRMVVNPTAIPASGEGPLDQIGSQLLRHCFEQVWQARMWLAEVAINHKSALALYRQNGFQPLAQVTYWELSPEVLTEQAQREPDLPNLMTVSNADAQLLYQLDTAAMPPLLRQVFDQQIQDFKVEPLQDMAVRLVQRMQRIDVLRGYVFEPQRKAAIGRFELTVSCDGRRSHQTELTVHPAYTWLYPEMVSYLARVLQGYAEVPLRITSRDYQPEREDYFTQLGANPVDHTLMLSRSVWHKVRETKPVSLEGLQLPEVLPGLQPVGKPMPGGMSRHGDTWPEAWQTRSLWRKAGLDLPGSEGRGEDVQPSSPPKKKGEPGAGDR